MATSAADTARSYYNSASADHFYHTVWGGEDIHVGIYESDGDTVLDASHRSVAKLASLLTDLNEDTVLLDIGSGYGGSARYLVREFGVKVDCLNISEVQNARNRRTNVEADVADQIRTIGGSFEHMPLRSCSYHAVWSEDCLVHSGDRDRVFEEVDRVLRSGGEFVLSDLMVSEPCPPEVLGPILARIQLASLGSFRLYRQMAAELGWRELHVVDLSPNVAAHYGRILDDLRRRYDELRRVCDKEYLSNMDRGLQHWIAAGENGHMHWGMLHFRKP